MASHHDATHTLVMHVPERQMLKLASCVCLSDAKASQCDLSCALARLHATHSDIDRHMHIGLLHDIHSPTLCHSCCKLMHAKPQTEPVLLNSYIAEQYDLPGRACTRTANECDWARLAASRCFFLVDMPALPLCGGGRERHALHVALSSPGRNDLIFPSPYSGHGRELYDAGHIRQALAKLQTGFHPSMFQNDLQVAWTCLCEADMICSLSNFDPHMSQAGTIGYTLCGTMNTNCDVATNLFFVYGNGTHWRAIGLSTQNKTIYLMDPYGVVLAWASRHSVDMR